MYNFDDPLNIIELSQTTWWKMNSNQLKSLHQVVLGTKRRHKSQYKAEEPNDKANNRKDYEKILPPIFSYGLYQTSTLQEAKKELKKLYIALKYSIQQIETPPIQKIKLKMIKLPNSNKKLLFIDLDETLIHSQAVQTLNQPRSTYRMRPYAHQFLISMSKLYDIYIFTASTREYCEPIVSEINQNGKPIKGLLHRKHCLKTSCGFYIKDLRIIENHDLDKMVIIDNLAYSFAFQINNGIPIQSFYFDSNAKILQNLQVFLTKLSGAKNVSGYLKQKLKLNKILEKSLQQYIEELQGNKMQFNCL